MKLDPIYLNERGSNCTWNRETDKQKYQFLSNQMIELMLKKRGIGLAANQCGLRMQFFVMKKDDEVVAIVIRDSEGFEQSAQDGVVNWLDERRPMLQEFDPVNRHTIPMTGDLIE